MSYKLAGIDVHKKRLWLSLWLTLKSRANTFERRRFVAADWRRDLAVANVRRNSVQLRYN